jgi:hypothetical protein
MAADWSAIEDALQAWVKTSTGLGDTHVFWSDQGVNRPAPPFVSLTLDGPRRVGVDAIVTTTDLLQDNGEEILVQNVGNRECTLRVQHFGGDPCGDVSSRAVMAKCLTDLYRMDVKAALEAAGVAILDVGPVENVAGVRALQIEPRAALVVRLAVADEAGARTGYIATAEVDGTIS